MAKLTVGSKSVEVKDGSNLRNAAESLGIPFSCGEGVCGSCLCKVTSGAENLSGLNSKEKDYGLTDGKKRLICQCKIKSGEVKIASAF